MTLSPETWQRNLQRIWIDFVTFRAIRENWSRGPAACLTVSRRKAEGWKAAGQSEAGFLRRRSAYWANSLVSLSASPSIDVVIGSARISIIRG